MGCIQATTHVAVTIKCPRCGAGYSRPSLDETLSICQGCSRYLLMTPSSRIRQIADSDSFVEFECDVETQSPIELPQLKPYTERLMEARALTGEREAIVTGRCRIEKHAAVLMIFDFEFLGGTMGCAVGEKIVDAFEQATRSRLPVVCVIASGGARVQEGMPALMQMARVAAAVAVHNRAGLAFISVLTDPTFGGVSASLASLGDVIVAEPGAQIGFVGPRVIEQTTGVAPAKDAHLAETLLRAGLIDMIVPRPDLRGALAFLLTGLRKHKGGRPQPRESLPACARDLTTAWERVALARHPGRPTASFYIDRLCNQFMELHGDRAGRDDRAIIGGLGDFEGSVTIVIAQERGYSYSETTPSQGGMAFPEGYRKAQRLMRLAAKFGIPVVTLVDCANAQQSVESEHHGIAHALASNLADMSSLGAPIVSVIIGQGGSGGAVAMAVGDRVLMQEYAIYTVISPEGAASILYRDVQRAETVAEALRITSHDLLELGIVDGVIPEPLGGAHMDPELAAFLLRRHLRAALRDVCRISLSRLVATRYRKYRRMGRVRKGLLSVGGRALRNVAAAFTRLFPRSSGRNGHEKRGEERSARDEGQAGTPALP